MMTQKKCGALLLAAFAAGAAVAAHATSAHSASLVAQEPRARAYVDAQLRPVVSGMSAGADWLTGEEQVVAAQICANAKDMKLGVTRRMLASAERKLCDTAGRKAIFQKKIGAIVVAPVAQPGAFADISTRHLFEALAAEDLSGQVNRRTKWIDIDPALPDAPIKVQLPPAGSAEDAALTTALMRVCLAQRMSQPSASAAERIAACARLRSDGTFVRAGAAQSTSAWLASAGPGGLALVGYAQIAAEAALTGLVPLDGLLPTAEARMRGEYPASLPVYFVASFAGRNPLERNDRATALADAILAEGAIGPQGRAALAGLAPLPAADRVALRQDFARFLAKGGVWE